MEYEEEEDEVDAAKQALQTFGGPDSYRTLAPEPEVLPRVWGVRSGKTQQGNVWQGVGSIADNGMMPGVVVSNTTQATAYSAKDLLAQ